MTTTLKFNPFTKKLDYVGTSAVPVTGILTINAVGPDGGGNFTLQSAGGSVTIAPIVNGLDLSVTNPGTTSYVLDAGGPVSPVAGVITLNGIGGNASGTTGAGQIYVNNKRWQTSYVVDASSTPGTNGEYTTIQAAINAANAAGGGEVFIRSSTTPYTENLTLRANVNISALSPEGRITGFGGYGTTISGNHTLTGDGLTSFRGINFSAGSGTIFTTSGATTLSAIGLVNCGSTLTGDFSNISTAGGFAVITAIQCNVTSSGAVSIIGAGTVFASYNSQFASNAGTAFVTSGNLSLNECSIGALTNAVEVVATSGGCQLTGCGIQSDTGILFTTNGGCNSFNNIWNCSTGSGFYIDGVAGSYSYANDNMVGSATAIAPGISQNRASWRPRSQVSASATTNPIYGVCGFDSASFTSNDGFIELVGGPGPALLTITPDSGGPISPIAGTINLNGLGGNLTGSTAAGQVYVDNLYWQTQYVVDPSSTPGSRGSYQTIQAAINAAAASVATTGTVFIRAGIYTENLALISGVNIRGYVDGRLAQSQPSDSVTIIGHHICTSAVGIVAIENLAFQCPTADPMFDIASAGGSPGDILIIGMNNCLTSSTGGSPNFLLSNTGGTGTLVSSNNCLFNSTAGFAILNPTSAMVLSLTDISAGSTTADSVFEFNNDSLIFNLTGCSISTPGTLFNCQSNLSSLQFLNNRFTGDQGILGVGAVTIQADVSNNTWDISSGTGFYINAGGTATINYRYGNDLLKGTASQIDPAVNQNRISWRPRATAGTSGTAFAGTASFDSDDFTVTDGFVEISGSSTGTAQTIGAVTADVITTALGATPGTFQFEARVKGFESTTPAGAGYNIFATFRTDGATATLVGLQDIYNEEAALAAADAYFVASGNNAVLQVLGVAGLTIDWSGESVLT